MNDKAPDEPKLCKNTESDYPFIEKLYPISIHTLQVTIAPTSGSSCVSVSLTTEITGN